jgi:hemoglobin
MSNPATLYERIGGEKTVSGLVDSFYQHVLQDPLLEPFFRDANIQKLIGMQHEFFTMALGGPIEYQESTIYKAHFGRGIKQRHFARFVHHLFETLQDYNLIESEIEEVIARVNTYFDDVVGGHGLDS